MSNTLNKINDNKMTNYRWTMCAMLFFATAVNYLDRQVLSLTFEEFIKPEFHWTDDHYGTITAFFSILYAVSMLFAGKFVDWIGTKKGYLWSIGVWSVGAIMHAGCGWFTEVWLGYENAAALIALEAGSAAAVAVGTISMYAFLVARAILAIGEAGNFPAAIKVTAEYFPKRDRAYATSIFNAGATVGALLAPVTIPTMAKYFKEIGVGNGWEMAFIIVGAVGFIWMGMWVFMYDKPATNKRVNKAELAYIESDNEEATTTEVKEDKKMSFKEAFRYKQTWSFAVGKFMTDGVWWFFLFWTPSYIDSVFGIKASSTQGILMITVLYAITMLSIYGGKLPTIIMKKTGLDPYAARMRAMLIFAFFPLLALMAQPLGSISPWFPIIIIGIAGAAHQSWSANIFSTIGDMFPKYAIATITGIGGMAGGISAFIINKSSGLLFTHAEATNMTFMGFNGKPAGYFMIFSVCAVAYLVGWLIMKSLVPKYKPIIES